jgi:glycosyltransferase involved in cell wall biosynthesis
MNILLVNHYAGSIYHGMEYRPYYLAQEWVKAGHQVTIIASDYSHVRTNQPTIKQPIEEENIDGITYVWIKTPEYNENGVKRFLNMLSFVRKLSAHAQQISETYKPDVVIASSTYPLDIYPAKKIAKRSKAKLIFEVHDLWPLSPKELGNMPWYHPFILVMQKGENDAYRYADKVVSLLPKADEHMIQHGMAPDKFVYIPNGIVVSDWEESVESIPEQHKELIEQLRKEYKFLVGYAGTHGIANALEDLVSAAEQLKDEPLAFVLVGKGSEKEHLIELASRKGVKNLYFLPPINKKSIPDFLEKMDALYIGWNRSPLYKFGVSPNKLLDYLMAAKPIVHAIDAGNDLVKESKSGLSVEPESPSQIAQAVKTLASTPLSQRIEMGKNGREFCLTHHDYNILANNFLDMMKSN